MQIEGVAVANLIRHTAVWTGSPGLPGYTQFYQEVTGDIPAQAQDGHYAVQSFFADLTTLLPEEVSVLVDPVYQVLVIGTGETVSEGTVGDPTDAEAGEFVGDWQRQVGVLVEWLTGTYIGGRRLRGRTYLVPLGAVSSTDGTLPAATIPLVETAADVIVNATAQFVVWHRPVNGAGGQVSSITGRVVRDKAALLRSRMD